MEAKKLIAMVKRYELEAKDLAALDGTEAELRASADVLLEKLGKSGGATLLVKTAGNEMAVPADVAIPLADLRMVTTKLELLPGVRRNLTEEVARLRQEVQAGYESLRNEYRQKAKEALAVFVKTEMDANRAKCGGDMARSVAPTNALIEASEAKRWTEFFIMEKMQDCNSDSVRHLVARIERFDAGKPLAACRT